MSDYLLTGKDGGGGEVGDVMMHFGKVYLGVDLRSFGCLNPEKYIFSFTHVSIRITF